MLKAPINCIYLCRGHHQINTKNEQKSLTAFDAESPTSFLHLHSKALNKMFVYNHKQSEWREQAAMKTPRAMFGAVVHNGKIIVVGGVNEEGLTASCEAYDFATNKYEYVCNFPVK